MGIMLLRLAVDCGEGRDKVILGDGISVDSVASVGIIVVLCVSVSGILLKHETSHPAMISTSINFGLISLFLALRVIQHCYYLVQ
jgi:hypothetical protein